ncbi:protein phosphatase [Ferrimonas gelatinilytica]|uniref:Cyclin-dependent kinase inhibitor 3 family protein n=1 Tax=Ferrimonas gelatinilytica TaxID=1255257 RepID=A0ABP9SEL6_9GAMM
MSFSPVLTEADGFKLALHPAPGLEAPLAEDIALLKAAGVSAVVTTLTEAELASLGLTALGQSLEAARLSWFHLPVEDKSLPAGAFDARWPEALPQLKALLEAGERVSVHCRGGTGRTGLVAAKLVLSCGGDWDKTLAAIRAARPGALTAESQLDYLKAGR